MSHEVAGLLRRCRGEISLPVHGFVAHNGDRLCTRAGNAGTLTTYGRISSAAEAMATHSRL